MKNGEQSAFPITKQNGLATGLTKLEHFSGIAMMGILQNLAIADKSLAELQREYYSKKYPGATEFECVAKESIGMAEELLRQLEEKSK